MTSRSLPAIACAALMTASAARVATNRQCTDPCLGSARAERRDCTTSASGVFLDATAACIERDVPCVKACRSELEDCRDATSLGADLARCGLENDAATLDCRVSFPLEPRRLAICVGRAQIAGFRCRRDAIRTLRASLKACRADFSACADACGSGGPAGGTGACRAEGKAARQDALQQCKVAYRATASACIDRDVGCVQDCVETRQTCNAPARAALDGVMAECAAARAAAVAACEAANPSGGTAFETCVQAALATAFDCRETAIESSLPNFTSCTGAYVGCLRGCPPGSTS